MNHYSEVLGMAVVFSAISYVITQFFQHRQRMKMIDRGITKLEFSQTRGRSLNSIKYGMVAIALGLAILIAQILEDLGELGGFETGLALVPLFIGVALIVSAVIERKQDARNGSTTDVLEVKQ